MIFTRPLHLQRSKGSKPAFRWYALRRQTHVEPVRAILDHPLAFSGELAKVRGENRGGNDCLRHCLSGLQERSGTVILGYRCH